MKGHFSESGLFDEVQELREDVSHHRTRGRHCHQIEAKPRAGSELSIAIADHSRHTVVDSIWTSSKLKLILIQT